MVLAYLPHSYRRPYAPVTILDNARQLARIDLRPEWSAVAIFELIDEACAIMGATREERLTACGCAILALRDERLMTREHDDLFGSFPRTPQDADRAFERACAIARSPQPGAVINVLT